LVFVYRVYSLDDAGRVGFPDEVKAENDDAAMALARDLVPHAVKCELWQDRRLVATLGDEGWMREAD
jgi:hypothetical protein